ncbi:MAG TPA: DNA adenine methylase [Spirochaetota bacterium]|jgi:DNA adenine methylase|nr:MAG: Modification methylase DpnIIA [Spirochaetes bacterium ADurb.Bin133]HNZ25812.1 DNA adenine methylase [Spirochaetota bacterium]HPY88701.1 DNA adenine methylase [Spirochaetota bacterium]HQB61893.1 DNA adenine methylase [Spirochaetota bacterium]
MIEIVSPLRYPGGKSRAIKNILPLIPYNFDEFIEPFVGGGSVFISAKQNIFNNAKYVINDLNFDLYCFWKYAKEKNRALYNEVLKIKEQQKDGRVLFDYYTKNSDFSDFDKAVRFFILNRITFSGTVDSGGYSQKAFEGRFTYSSIERIKPLQKILENVDVFNKDYEEIIYRKGNNNFIFLDPPYYRQAKSRLYGKNGNLHTSFDHIRFAESMKKCKHKWLITLDDTKEIKDLYDFAYINEWELQYGMNNYKKEKAEIGKELFISNYKIKLPKKYKEMELF